MIRRASGRDPGRTRRCSRCRTTCPNAPDCTRPRGARREPGLRENCRGGTACPPARSAGRARESGMSSLMRKTVYDAPSGPSDQKWAEIKPQDATWSNRVTQRSGDRDKRSTTVLESAEMRSEIASSTTHRRVAPHRRNQTERCW